MRRGSISVAAALAAAFALAACADGTAPERKVEPVVEGRLMTPDDAALFATRSVGESFSVASLAEAADEDDGERTICVGVLTGTFESVVVPEGAECYLAGAVVRKHVVALERSALGMGNATIGGDVRGKKASSVNIDRSWIGGNVHVHDGGPHPAYIEFYLCGSTVAKGKVEIQKMRGGIQIGPSGPVFCNLANRIDNHLELKENFVTPNRTLSVRGTQVGGDGKIFRNEGPGSKVVQGNTFAKQLDCKGNAAPFVGGPNAAKRTEGQCF